MAVKTQSKPTPSLPKGPKPGRFFTDPGAIRGQGARWSHDQAAEGDTLVGRLIGTRAVPFADGKVGTALVFSPAILTSAADGDVVAHRTCELLLSAALEQRIMPDVDKGVVFAVQYDGREASQHKGRTPFKTFTVAVIEPDVLAAELRACEEPELVALLASSTV